MGNVMRQATQGRLPRHRLGHFPLGHRRGKLPRHGARGDRLYIAFHARYLARKQNARIGLEL